MALYIQVPLIAAERVKHQLMQKNAFDHQYLYIKEGDHILFPVTPKAAELGFTIVEREGKESKKPIAMKIVLASKLSEQELEALKSSFDTVGTIAILEIDEELKPKEQLIAQELLSHHKSIKTVVAKDGIHKGEFRTQDHRFLAGEKTFETIHKENGVSLLVDINVTYFSPRLSTERKRIAGLVRTGERVLVMFSGAAPYPCVLAKHTNAKEIIGIEKNPQAHALGLNNIALNKTRNIKLYCGDVKKIVPTLGTFDRILMPLPKSAHDFLDVAIPALTIGGVLHFYDFLDENEFAVAKHKIKEAAKAHKRQVTSMDIIKCGQHAPRVYRICVDAIIK